MLLTNRFKLFNKKGYNLNPSYSSPIRVVINDPDGTGYGATINAYTNPNREIDYVEILSGGDAYGIGTYIEFIDDFTGAIWTTADTDITLSVTGEITSFTIPTSTSNKNFTYPAVPFFVNQFLDPVSTGLIATDHIFVIENVYDVNGRNAHTFPRVEEYGPFVISSYESNGQTTTLNIETFAVTGSILPGAAGANKMVGIPAGTIANLKVGMYLVGTNIPVNTRITAIDSTYNFITISNNLSITGAYTFTCYEAHNLRKGNKIRIFDTAGPNNLEGEHVITGVTTTKLYISSTNIAPLTTTSTLFFGVIPVYSAYVASNSDSEFFLFDVSYNVDYPTITKRKQVYFELTNASIASPPDSIPTGVNTLYQRTVNDSIEQRSLQINIGLQADVEGVYTAQINIDDVTYPTPKSIFVGLYEGNTVAEDERLGSLLENFGRDVDMDEELIMRDSDVNEDRVDNILLNAKRKEMLLEGDNIWPYVGSYKGLVNVINWFGYYDIRIKEYWLNVNIQDEYYGKYRQMEIPFQLKDKGKESEMISILPSSHYKKTNMFGLYYDITRDSGNFDEFGVPITEDAFAFTNEEVLIKLFALKRYLKNKFLPLNTRIVDITGEGVYYERYGVNTWYDPNVYLNIELTRDIDFKTNSPVELIDIRPFDDDAGMVSPDPNTIVSNYYNRFKITDAVISNPGGPYYGVIPQVSFVGNSVNQPRGIVKMKADVASVTFSSITGADYAINDIITLAGGSYENPIRLKVTTVDGNGGVIDADIISGPNQGSLYASLPISFSQALVLRPSGNTFTVPNAKGFNCLATDIPLIAEDIYFYDRFNSGEYFSTLPTAVFTPSVGGISALLDVTTVNATSVGYFSDSETVDKWVDAPGIPVGAPLNLSTAFDVPWDNLQYTWNELSGASDASFKAWVDGQLQTVEILNPGSDYSSAPSVTVSGGGGFNGTADSSILDGKIKILEYEVVTVSSSSGVNDVITVTPALPINGVYEVTTNKIVKNVNVPDGTMTSVINQPLSQIELSLYDGSAVTTSLAPGDIIYIHEGIDVLTSGTYLQPPTVSVNGGRGDSYTWDKLGRYDMYQMEWRLSLTGPENPNQQFNYYSDIKPIDDLINHTVVLPYEGEYTVEMVIYDTDNNFMIKRKKVQVILPEASFSFAARFVTDCVDTWDDLSQIPTPVFLPTPGQLNPPPPVGPKYDWEHATGRWVNPVFNPARWDDAKINWDRLEIGNSSVINNYNFPLENPLEVIQVSSEDNLEFYVISYEDNNSNPPVVNPTITVFAQRPYPQIEPLINPNDWIYIRRDDVIYQLEVLYADYSVPNQTKIELAQTPPLAFTQNPTTWQVLREIGGTIILAGNQIFDPVTNPKGIRIGEYVRLIGKDDVPKRFRQGITGKDNYTGNPNFITLPGIPADYAKGGEIGKIYKFRNFDAANGNLVWHKTLANSTWAIYPGQTTDPDKNDYLGKLYIKSSNAAGFGCLPAIPTDEIRPGFTNIKIFVEKDGVIIYEQRLRTIHTYFDTSNTGYPYVLWNGSGAGYNGIHVIDIATIDGGKLSGLTSQLTTWFDLGASIWLEYEYAEFTTRTYLGLNNSGVPEVYMDFNMYPATQAFISATAAEFPASTLPYTGWYYDHGIATGDYSLYVTNTGIWRNGLGTIVTVDDSNSELLRCSSSFIAYQYNFDTDNAEQYIGSLTKTWENSKLINWNESCYQSWDTLDYQPSLGCEFKISKIQQNGGMQMNNDIKFLFTGIVGGMSIAQRWSQALYELRNTDNPAFSRYYYQLSSESDMNFILGRINTYEDDTKIFDYVTGGPTPVIGDVIVAENIGPAQNITAVGTDLTLANPIPKRLSFTATSTAGECFLRNITGLMESEIFIGDVITGPGLPSFPSTPTTVLEIIAYDGVVRTLVLSTQIAVTYTWDTYYLEWITPTTSLIGFQHLLESGSFIIDAYADTQSVDHLGWLVGENGIEFVNEITGSSDPVFHSYPIKNVYENIGYGVGKIGGFLGGMKEFLMNERSLQVYFYEGVDPNNGKPGWYPANQLAPAYSFTNDPVFENYLNAETQANRLPYESAIGGSWRWEDSIIGYLPAKLPQGTSVLLTPDSSKIAGKTSFVWKIYEDNNLLVETSDPLLLWEFSYPGKFDIELTITDTNGNTRTDIKKDFFEIYGEE